MNLLKTALAMGSALGIRELSRAIESVNVDSVLGVAGLERKPSALSHLLPMAGLITVSAAVGAGVALLLAPSSGSQLRTRLSDGLGEAKHRLSDTIDRAGQTATTRASRHVVS